MNSPAIRYNFSSRHRLLTGHTASNAKAPSARTERRKAEKLAKLKAKKQRKNSK